MDIVLDSNIYLSDIRLQSNRFANFFDYVRRTRSSIILPALVRDEVAQKHREKLTAQLSRVEKELKELRRYTTDDVTFNSHSLDYETKSLKALLRRPSKGVRTRFHASTEGVELNEVIRRGIKRLPPASESGEELRDVVLWLIVLAHAKSTSRPTAFVTTDTGFWESDKPKGQILQDIASQQVDVRLYRDLAQFTKGNALVSEAATESWVETHLSSAKIEEIVVGPALHRALKKRGVAGNIEKITPLTLQFVSGSVYKIDARTDFAELDYRGSFIVHSTSVHYPIQSFERPWSGQGLGNLLALRDLLNPTGLPPSLSGLPQGRGGEVQKHTYEAGAEIRFSCRADAENTEAEVDSVRAVSVVARQ
jgi:hypothetical protein